jgi:putative Holliday junction resolvase
LRVLAVDPGTVRCGLAVSDETGLLASPAGIIDVRGGGAPEAIARKAAELGVSLILVGHPLNMDGTAGPRAQAVERLVADLRTRTALEVRLVDERLTSFEAEWRLEEAGVRTRDRKGKRDKGRVDQAAAAVLLQDWLDDPRNRHG